MTVNPKRLKRSGLGLLMLIALGGCAATPPRPVALEAVDRDQITAALQEPKLAPSPGPPPFLQKTAPATSVLALPETLYSMTLSDVPLSTALEALMQDSELNLSVAAGVDLTTRITVHLQRATFVEAMDMVVKDGAGYAWTVESERVFIRTFMERIYAFDYLDMAGETEIEVGGDMLASSVEEAGVSGKYVVRTSQSAETTDVWAAIEATLDTMKSAAGITRINRTGGVIYMADTPPRVAAMTRFLDAMGEALNRQVFIEAKIMEVRLTDRQQLGIDWSAMNVAFSASNFVVDQFNLNFNAGSTLTLANQSAFNAVVDFLRTQGEVSVVSNPHLALMNGRSAVLTVGFQFPFGDIDGVDRDEETKVVTYRSSIRRVILGLQFGLAVQISADGLVTMNIVPTITRIQENATVELPTSANTVQSISNPIIDLQELSTTVRVRDGNTVVLAGLISQMKKSEHKGVPFFGSLPLVGGWFKHVDDSAQSRELVIFITPHVRGGI